jgi:hypothetical protein
MALTLAKSTGTQAATINTEHTLLTEAAAGIYVLFVNLKNLADADIVELRAYTKVLTGDANPLCIFEQSYKDQQGDAASAGSSAKGPVHVKSPPVESPFSLIWTLKQTAGTGRNFDWREDQLT